MMRDFAKYLFDRFFALTGLLITFPVFILIAFFIRIGSKGPVFFRQTRVGRNGRFFTIYKFRTMTNHDDTNTVTASNDPRITDTGKFLRKWKLDELPELYNILKGDMSFVGPRPDVQGYTDRLTGEERKILLLRPGITGPSTLKYIDEEAILAKVDDPVKYNDEVIFPDKVKINLRYLERYSLAEDLKLIFYTLIRRKIDEY